MLNLQDARAAALLAAVERMERHAFNRRAVHLHLSKLLHYGISSHHIRIARAVFETAVQGLEGEIFALANGDIIFVGLAKEVAATHKAVDKLHFLLENQELPEDLASGDGLATWFSLDLEYDEFLRHVRALAVEEGRRRKLGERDPAPRRRKRPLDPRELAEIERALSTADLSPLVRRQPVCMIGRDFKPRRILTELYSSIHAVQEAVAPGIDLAHNRYLFQYLTTVLDEGMLALLRRDQLLSEEQVVAININLDTLLSQKFLDFDTSLAVGARGRLVLELQQCDVLGNLRDYSVARDFAREQGYRICIDNTTAESLVLLDRRVLRYDFVKIAYTPEVRRLLKTGRTEQLKEGIEKVGPPRVILHRCEDETAVREGHALGIDLFQGHFVDHLLPLTERARRA